MRYSPHPIEHYGRKVAGEWVGPSTSQFLRGDNEAWNLAFLSHPFERQLHHPDPRFAINVSATVRTRLDDGTRGPVASTFDSRPDAPSVRSLLMQPASVFVRYVMEDADLREMLSLFQIYGAPWVEIIRERAPLCGEHPAPATVRSAADEFLMRELEKDFRRPR